MPIFTGSSDSEDERTIHKTTKLFTRQRSIHSIFGGGKGIYLLNFFIGSIVMCMVNAHVYIHQFSSNTTFFILLLSKLTTKL